ncbi:MAG: hypothetical protein KGL10_08655 [Alphaproteobacteria bacterium]|nr:hypothetical protein [Alphaproteobacteria bacterium]MDE2337370.1 hypothetical protein [Alphaproteobacteria bacterium]
MRTLHAFCTLLLLITVGLFAFDLLYHWAIYGQAKVITVGHLWKEISKTGYINASAYAETVVPAQAWEIFSESPAQIALLGIAAVLYLPLLVMKLFTKKKDR